MQVEIPSELIGQTFLKVLRIFMYNQVGLMLPVSIFNYSLTTEHSILYTHSEYSLLNIHY